MLTARQQELEAARRRAVVRVVSRVQECLPVPRSAVDPLMLDRHPLAAFIYRVVLREGPAGRTSVEEAFKILESRAERDGQRLREGKVIGLQCGVGLPARETREASLDLASVEESTLEAVFDEYDARVTPLLPAWWRPYARIAASYTVVMVNGRPAPPRFSGTHSDAFGAIHGAVPGDAETCVEVLTHEAGHLWLNLLVEQDPAFIQNPYAEQRFVSPWRKDARPIHGILHGAYVFSVVIPVLLSLRTESAKGRAAQLAVEVRDAIRQVLAFGLLSSGAREIVEAAEKRVRDSESELGREEWAAAKERYALEKEQKVRQLRERHTNLQVAWRQE